jgi:hypothetical protein
MPFSRAVKIIPNEFNPRHFAREIFAAEIHGRQS